MEKPEYVAEAAGCLLDPAVAFVIGASFAYLYCGWFMIVA
jgi:hypothetical protein